MTRQEHVDRVGQEFDTGPDVTPTQRREGDSVRPPRIFRETECDAPTHAVAAIGNFDGVHLGHRHLIDVAKQQAGGTRPAAVLTFEPHPRDFFRPEAPGFRLTSPAAKVKILGAIGVEIMFVRRFDGILADMSAPDFVSEVLVRDFGISDVVAGTNFHFGRNRAGTPALLEQLAQERGMVTHIVPAVESDGIPVSSSRIREALIEGDIALANRLLGHRWFVEGVVVHGDKRGRTLGFPTANVRLGPGCRLAHGIYAVRVATRDFGILGGVASYGRRPTFDDGPPLLETFLFDFAGDLYDTPIEIEFLDWIRGEERFGSADDLVQAMNRDAERARAIIAAAPDTASYIG